jgi:plastocyanin
MALALSACALASAARTGPASRTYTVTIEQMRFTPARITVAPGDVVEWVNADLVPHTATVRDGAFDSGQIAAGSSWRWTARTRGTTPYVCALHPTMAGIVEVR